MNKRERVPAAFHNRDVDYVPGCFWRHYIPELQRGEDIVSERIRWVMDAARKYLPSN